MNFAPRPMKPMIRKKIEAIDVLKASAKAHKEGNIEWAKKVGAFWRFLNQLDPSKFEIYYQEEDNGHTGKEGWLVVHFPEKITEKWNDTWQTWFGISCYMS